jgi:hypothetical protein
MLIGYFTSSVVKTGYRFGRCPARLALALAVFSISANCAYAFEINLPAVGTNVRYDYFLAIPELPIATGVTADQAVDGQVIFADGKNLRIDLAPDSLLNIDLLFQAPGLQQLFDLQPISFNEQLSFLGQNGAIASIPKNSAAGYFPDTGDRIEFRWQTFVISQPDIYGFAWHITPDLVSGARLPDSLTLYAHLFSAEPIIVVSEPSSAAMFTVGAMPAILFMLCRNRRN